ncbi:hypothetical protein GXB85_16845 [Cellulomonas sp. APG4]|uniref:O-antigen ligase family protein n=1 Tax=Cellulomonas sp. APG4 TaxID=1538656 RepID=UPI00137AE200|nr:O-antigen ligase family protein [Cellulomonas sp. APG4]NCT92604.1 hypothetical protein [Cellulomonas sp. APG4]
MALPSAAERRRSAERGSGRPGPRGTAGPPRRRATPRTGLPSWPVAGLLAGFPVWWLLGLGELVWPLAAVVMLAYLGSHRHVRVPRGFGVYLLLLVWIVASGTQVDTAGRMVGFVYRLTLYVAAAVLFVYVYNARRHLGQRYLLGLFTVFFAWVVLGGYLGLAFPTATIRTPLAMVLPDGVLSNELAHQMAVRRLTQYNPDAWNVIDPRPSAPFLYTNNWGNAYSLLVPLVGLYLREVRGTRRFWPVAALLPVSLVPAFLTLNRGMFVGLGFVLVLVAARFALGGRVRALGGIVALAVMAAVVVQLLPVTDRLENRLESSGTNESRLTVYTETIRQTLGSPLLGFGAPRPAEGVSIEVPALGTQGQVWMVLFSHGFVGLALFLGWLVWLVARSWRRRDVEGVVMSAVLAAVLVEAFFYGLLGPGLGIAMLVGGLALRPPERHPDLTSPHGAAPPVPDPDARRAPSIFLRSPR